MALDTNEDQIEYGTDWAECPDWYRKQVERLARALYPKQEDYEDHCDWAAGYYRRILSKHGREMADHEAHKVVDNYKTIRGLRFLQRQGFFGVMEIVIKVMMRRR